MGIKETAQNYLKLALKNPGAVFREGQWDSIDHLLDRKRVLVVQRTGWGKSMVYFLAAKLLRDRGAGPTLLISPLLSLMRNQLEAAERIGIIARSINSSNNEEWPRIEQELARNTVDVLMISPERLANSEFRHSVLTHIAHNIGLFVIDEAHCISDWGHDFRPDYRRIARVLEALPSNVPILATTATANNRVVNDVMAQLGEKIFVQRGSLVRKSLKLQNISLPGMSARMAWLAKTIPTLPGSGIVYTLTQRDAERVAKWLKKSHINAEAYHAGLTGENGALAIKENLEQRLLKNEIKVLVATVALGMGFDKPDLGFVIHFQRPASVVHYYQQVGRAGRAVDEAYGVLLCGEEDESITEYFINSAFPPQHHVSQVIEALDESEDGLSISELQRVINLHHNIIDKTLKYLSVESPSPITKIGLKWRTTATASSYRIDRRYVETITGIRRDEQRQMRDYMNHSGCLMAFLQAALDDPYPENCGKCKNCNPDSLLDESYNADLAKQAEQFLRGDHQPLRPRKKWPLKDMFELSPFSGSFIGEDQQACEGRALSLWRDEGWGRLVACGKYQTNRFSDDLVTACLFLLKEWSPNPPPKWVTCIPSLHRPELVPFFAERLANALGLPFVPCIVKVRDNQPQKEMANSYQQAKNLDGVFRVVGGHLRDECLLVDDVIHSGWTFAVASALLRKVGCSAVYPLALALNSLGDD